ncbi:MAG: response regulator [Bacteroidia bacterium]|nr:response regulator [Bacteroidia bacterium]MDW8159772.1 response regulator [Bacteroidia bacterium]
MKLNCGEYKILIVDDNPTNLQVLRAALHSEGYQVLAANTGERALQIAQNGQPHLILLDINMPGINGFEVCKELKNNPTTQNIPVIFISALDDAQSKVQGFEMGGVDYVTKPFNKEEVFARVRTHLTLSNLTQHLETRNQELAKALSQLQETQNKLAEINNELLDSITYAARLQEALMPPKEYIKSLFPESFIFFQPRNIVSGDFYWFHKRRNKVFVAVADCTGHGVPGAFMSILGLNMLNNLVEERGITEPSSILEEMDYEIEIKLNQKGKGQLSKDGMDIALCNFDFRLRSLQYACAMRSIILISNGSLIELKGERHPVGGAQYENNIFTNHRHELLPGDVIYLFSDGYTDQFGGEGPHYKKFGIKRFQQLLLDIHTFDMDFQCNILQEEFNKWKGQNSQLDDVLVLGLRFIV